jgi:outer membrane receptor protein involved in Fe transport
LFAPTAAGSGLNKETKFTPRVSLQWQFDAANQVYATYAKGFRPGGANNPLPYAACADDFVAFGIPNAPEQFGSDTVNSYEIGAKSNFANRFRIAASVYYIKWDNIQQTVLPPVCQITFIANLGEAVAWGGDIQAELAVTDALTAQLSAGYTDARYSKDSKFPNQDLSVTAPLVRKNNAVIGQSGSPGSPFTAALGLEYRFGLFDREMFARADWQYQAHSKWPSARQDPLTNQYNAAFFTLPSTSFASLRIGMTVDDWTVSAFVDNLTDTHRTTGYAWDFSPGSTPGKYYTFRPRTFGLGFILNRG